MKKAKGVILTIVFFLILAMLLSVVTLICYPKWKPDTENNPQTGIYLEEENSIDILVLGSCNIYTSFSPVVFYEQTGVTSYGMTAPDQHFSTAYYYLKEALKTQKPKLVVLEALLLTDIYTADRETYDREALDYMNPSIDKLINAYEIVNEETEYLRTIKTNTPGRLLTFMGYLFPLLRYHSRTDLTSKDLTFFLESNRYSYYKGSVPFFNYTTMDDLAYDEIHNGYEIVREAQEFFPKIKALCEEEGIEFLVVKSPNYWRWDEERTNLAKNYVEAAGVPFLDFHSGNFGNYDEYDYQKFTGRLNIYGMKKFTTSLGKYLTKNYELPRTILSAENEAKWGKCVEKLYNEADEKWFNISAGQIAQLKCEDDSIFVRWNPCIDCDRYQIYKSSDGENFSVIAESNGEIWYDKDVENGKMYYYAVEPMEGSLKGVRSETMEYIFLSAPEGFSGERRYTETDLSWEENPEADGYQAQWRISWEYVHKDLDITENTYFTHTSTINAEKYSYRLMAVKYVDGKDYYSDSVNIALDQFQK